MLTVSLLTLNLAALISGQILFNSETSLSWGGRTCNSREGLPCQLPFTFQGKEFYECWTLSPGYGDVAYGRCPVRLLNQTSREASSKAEDWQQCGPSCPLQTYTPNKQLEARLASLAEGNPQLVRFFSVGTSHLGQDIPAVQISKGVNQPRTLLKPKVRYVGNMHGNEPVGRELLLHLAERLVAGYGRDRETTWLLDSTDITLIPTINPDGFDRAEEGQCTGENYEAGRFNEGSKDLNRDFPTWQQLGANSSATITRQPETLAMMDLIKSEPWVLSANFHGGALVASYPWDDYRQPGGVTGRKSLTPDHDIFHHLALTYANHHLTMQNHSHCLRWNFQDGTTNGAEWYPLVGGMQDYNYLVSNDMEITLEISCCKYPKKYYLNRFWDENKASLFKYLSEVHRGIKGLVTDGRGRPVPRAAIVVLNPNGAPRNKNVLTSAQGEYWRILLPGQYKVRAEKDECAAGGKRLVSKWQQVILTESSPQVRLDLQLAPDEAEKACNRQREEEVGEPR